MILSDKQIFDIVKVVSENSTCCSRNVGAVVVDKAGKIIGYGSNGICDKISTCKDKGECYRRRSGFKSGEGLEQCPGEHAESKALLMCAKFGMPTNGGTVYISIPPCERCVIKMYEAGIKKVKVLGDYPSQVKNPAIELMKELEIEYIKVEVEE